MASIVEILIKIKDDATAALASLADGLTGASTAGSGLSGVLKDITIALGLGALGGAVVASIETWAEWQQSVVELNAALSLSGQYSEAASAQIVAMSEHIQDVTTVSKQSAIGVSEMAAAFTHLQPAELADLQKAAVGFQTVFGGGMEHAATLFTRSLEGSGIVLRRYGVAVDAMMTEHERFEAIMSRFGPMFQIAVTATDTLMGRFEQMKNQFQDLERTVGDLLSRILGVQGGLEGTKSIIENVNEWIKAHGDVLVAYGTRFVTVVRGLIELIPALFEVVLDKTVPLFKTVSGWVDTLEKLFARVSKTVLDAAQVGGGAHLVVTADMTQPEKNIIELEKRWNALIKLLQTPVEIKPLKAQLGTVTPGLGGESVAPATPPLEVRGHVQMVEELTSAQKTYDEELRSGIITYEDYLKKNAALRAEMQEEANTIRTTVLPAQGLSAAAHTAAIHAIDQLTAAEKRMGLEVPPEVEKALAAQRNLDTQLKAHLITNEKYAHDTAANQKVLSEWRAELEKDLKILGLTDAQIAKIMKTMSGIAKESKDSALSLGSVFNAIKSGFEKGGDAEANAVKNVQAYGQAFENDVAKGIATAMSAHEDFGRAVKKAVGLAAATEAKNSAAHAIFELAAGLADAAFGNTAGATKHFQASATYGLAAAEFGALGGALGGFSGGGGSGTGGGGAGSAATTQANSVTGKQATGTIVVEGGLLDMTDPRQAEAFNKALMDLASRGLIPQIS